MTCWGLLKLIETGHGKKEEMKCPVAIIKCHNFRNNNLIPTSNFGQSRTCTCTSTVSRMNTVKMCIILPRNILQFLSRRFFLHELGYASITVFGCRPPRPTVWILKKKTNKTKEIVRILRISIKYSEHSGDSQWPNSLGDVMRGHDLDETLNFAVFQVVLQNLKKTTTILEREIFFQFKLNSY